MRKALLILIVALGGCTDGRADPFGDYERLKVMAKWCDAELQMARTHADTLAVRLMTPTKHSYNCGILWVTDSVAFKRGRP